jgi:hypothetical protein
VAIIQDIMAILHLTLRHYHTQYTAVEEMFNIKSTWTHLIITIINIINNTPRISITNIRQIGISHHRIILTAQIITTTNIIM